MLIFVGLPIHILFFLFLLCILMSIMLSLRKSLVFWILGINGLFLGFGRGSGEEGIGTSVDCK